MTSESWPHHNVKFTQSLVGLLVKSFEFSNLCRIICQWHFKVFFVQICRHVTQKALQISKFPFRYWVLNNLWHLHF